MRPIAKVGLIAPFEGLYRETGYHALDAMRQALLDCSPQDAAVIPLALDDSNRPEVAARAAEKMMADPAVVAVIGPFSLDTVAAVAPHMAGTAADWIVPIAVDAAGQFASPKDGTRWLSDLILSIASMAESHGARVLLVAGLPVEWMDTVNTSVNEAQRTMPIQFVARGYDFGEMQADSALLWLGQPHEGADVAAEVQRAHPQIAVWLGPEGDSMVLPAHRQTDGAHYWHSWVTPQYNSVSQQAPGVLTKALTYEATCQALAAIYGRPDADGTSLSARAFRINEYGMNEPLPQP